MNSLIISFSILGLILLLFITLPLFMMIFATDPLILKETVFDSQVMNAILLTFKASLFSTIIAAVLGIPLAYVLARKKFPGKHLIEGIIDLPIVIPHTAAGIALLVVFGRRYIGGKLFAPFGISFVGAEPGIVIAMLFVSLSYLVDAAKEGFASVDERLEHVSRTLGAGPWRTFFTVSLPLAKRSILSGAVLMWARGLSEFGAVVVLSYHPMIAPVLIYDRFESYGLAYARPVAVLLILISLIIFVIIRLLYVGRHVIRGVRGKGVGE